MRPFLEPIETAQAAAATMSPSEALHRAVQCLGSQAKMAGLLGVTQSAVSKWLTKRQPLPVEHVLAVESATGIQRHLLRPDVYPDTPPVSEVASDRLEGVRP